MWIGIGIWSPLRHNQYVGRVRGPHPWSERRTSQRGCVHRAVAVRGRQRSEAESASEGGMHSGRPEVRGRERSERRIASEGGSGPRPRAESGPRPRERSEGGDGLREVQNCYKTQNANENRESSGLGGRRGRSSCELAPGDLRRAASCSPPGSRLPSPNPRAAPRPLSGKGGAGSF